MTPERCSGCGGPLAPEIAGVLDPESKERFSILACASCGLRHTSPRPGPEALGRYYGPTYYGSRHGITDAYCTLRRRRLLRRAVAPGRLLDVGCGDGAFLAAAREAGFEAAGVEPGAAAEAARKRGLNVVPSLDQVAAGPYAAITLWHSLEHVPDPAATLAAVRSLLAPGGALIVAVPDAEGLQARTFGRHWLHLDVPRHLHHFARRSLTALLQRSGFDVTGWANQELEYDLMGWMESAVDLLLPGRQALFRAVTGRPRETSLIGLVVALALAVPLGLAAVPATLVSTAVKRGGTLIAFAAPRSRP